MAARPRRVTLRDLANETGLSQAAVSYALRGMRVPEETQARVREAADRLGYQADPIARALASGRTGTVGLLCESLDDLWQQSVAAALGAALLDTGRSTLIVDVVNDPATEAKRGPQAGRPAGRRADHDPRGPWCRSTGGRWRELVPVDQRRRRAAPCRHRGRDRLRQRPWRARGAHPVRDGRPPQGGVPDPPTWTPHPDRPAEQVVRSPGPGARHAASRW